MDLYRAGRTASEVAKVIGGICPRTIQLHAQKLGICRDRQTGQGVIYNSRINPIGRERIDLIYRAVELRCYERHFGRRLGYSRIAQRLGVGRTAVRGYLVTPYAQALSEYVFGRPIHSKEYHAKGMIRQGCDTRLIARTLGMSEGRVEDLRMSRSCGGEA